MRIGVIGGLDRNARELQELARCHGHELELHTGVVSGPASSAGLRALVGRADLVVVLTDINSHNGVQLARRQARLLNRPLRIMRRLGPSRLAALLRETDVRPCYGTHHDWPPSGLQNGAAAPPPLSAVR
jgi:hypothetical protein